MIDSSEIFIKKADDLLRQYFPYGKCGTISAEKECFGFFFKQCGVYILCSVREKLPDEIIYIGVSDSIGARLFQHLPTFEERNVSKIKIVRIPDKAGWPLLKLEAILIDRFNPKYNKANPYLSESSPIPSCVNLENLINDIGGGYRVERGILR